MIASRLLVPQCIQMREIGLGAELCESGAGRVELELRAFVVAERAARHTEQHARLGRWVGHFGLLPALQREPQRAERGTRVAFGELNGAVGVVRKRNQDLRVETPRDRVKLTARFAGRRNVAGSEQDLDQRGKHARALELLVAAGGDAPDRSRRRVDAPLYEPQERQAGLRLETSLA